MQLNRIFCFLEENCCSSDSDPDSPVTKITLGFKEILSMAYSVILRLLGLPILSPGSLVLAGPWAREESFRADIITARFMAYNKADGCLGSRGGPELFLKERHGFALGAPSPYPCAAGSPSVPSSGSLIFMEDVQCLVLCPTKVGSQYNCFEPLQNCRVFGHEETLQVI